MTLSQFIQPEDESEKSPLEEPQATEEARQPKRVVHPARGTTPSASLEGAATESMPSGAGAMGSAQRGRFNNRLARQQGQTSGSDDEETAFGEGTIGSGMRRAKVMNLKPSFRRSKADPKTGETKSSPGVWNFLSIFSLLMNVILIVIVILLALRMNSLQKTFSSLLGGLYDNFVRMDRSVISTTIQMQGVPIPVNFILPITQEETVVTLTQAVTVRNAHVSIDTGEIRINAPATVTLPAGTSLPITLRLDVPVQTTVLMDLWVPVNIDIASAGASDPAVASMHTSLLGLQDAVGPLYCLLQPGAIDYLSQPVCDAGGSYMQRSFPQP